MFQSTRIILPINSIEFHHLDASDCPLFDTPPVDVISVWIAPRHIERCHTAFRAEVVPRYMCVECVGGQIGFAIKGDE